MRIERLDAGLDPVFRLSGRLEGLACRHLLRMLNGPVSDGSVVTIDLSVLDACDAKGADTFVALTRRARAAGGGLVLTAPRETILRVLENAGALPDLQLGPAQKAADRNSRRPRPLRYLTRVGEERPFAYAANRRDFYLVSDDTLWAHESHDWLLAAGSGAMLAHRTRNAYYDIDGHEQLFTETAASSAPDIDVRDTNGT